jgi:glycosyltransferase involved in cell wall biosynthesis
MTHNHSNLSIILPAKNESAGLKKLLPELAALFSDAEIIVVNDGSTDTTQQICEEHGVTVINHPYSMGNGAAIKSGARHASGDILVFMDADGQHRPEVINQLLDAMDEGHDMVVGARVANSHAGTGRRIANGIYNRLASLMVGHPIQDLTSGFRAVRAQKFREFLSLLPNGFSYPTTITMAFFRAGYHVAYIPIHAEKRIGKSHISLFKDGFRFFLIIFKIGTLYSPLKIFVPISFSFFLIGFAYYLFTFITYSCLINMSVLLFSTSIIVFLIGLVSEQITQLVFQSIKK